MPQVVLMCGQEVREVIEVADGTSLQQFVWERNPETRDWPAPTICLFGGQPALRSTWPLSFLRGDAVAVFAELPMGGGGGSNPMQMIFTVALMAAAAWAGPFVAGTVLGLTGPALGIASGIVSGGVMLLGGIVSSALFSSVPAGQMPAYQAEAASPTYSVNGSTNQARLYQPVPEQFGRFRSVPDLVADKWTQYIGNEMYLYQVFGCGRGTSQQHSLSFGDVEFWRDGRLIESAYTSESGSEYHKSVNVTLKAVADGGGWHGPYAATDYETATVNLTLEFPEGLCSYTGAQSQDPDNPGVVWTPVAVNAVFEAQYREAGASAWLHLASKTISGPTAPSSGGGIRILPGLEQPFTALMSGSAPGYGNWEVRIQNTSTIPDSVTFQGETKNTRKKAALKNITSASPSINVQIVEPGGTVTLFPDNVEVSINVSSQELLAPNQEGHDWIGPFPVNTPGTRINQILYSFVFGGGLGRYNDKGKLKNHTVNVEIQIQAIDDYGKALSEWSPLRAPSYTAGTLTAQRRTESCLVDEGRYQSRVRRTSDAGGNQTIDRVQWESMTAMVPGSLRYDQTVIAVKIKASNILSQNAANNFAVIQTRMLPLYDRQTKTWSESRPTRSFAAAMSHVCKVSYGGRLTDRQIDLDALWRIDEQLEAMNWHYDAWIDGAYTVWALVVEMCNAVRVVPRPGAVLSFVMDRAGRPVRHTFTPHDIVRGSFVLTWNTHEENSPDDVIVSYMDEDANYLQREVRAVLPESESRTPSTQTILGIANRDHAHDLGVFKAACNRWRRNGCEFETEGVGRVLNFGDVVHVSYPLFDNTASGAVAGWDADALMLQLESPLKIPEEMAGNAYLALTMPDGAPWGPVKLREINGVLVRFDPEDYALLLLQGFTSPFPWLTAGEDRLPTTCTLQHGREYSRRYIVTGIQPQTLYRHRVTCINDSDMVDSYNIPTPPWEFRSNLPSSVALPPPGNLRVSLAETEAAASLLSASWEEVAGASGYEVETGANGITWVRYGRVNAASVSIPVADDSIWLRVATVRGYEQSSWVLWH